MSFKIRKATSHDLDTIMTIIIQAQEMFLAKGIDQWQNGYPNRETIQDDIQNGTSYCIIKNETVVGTFMLQLGNDENYDTIDGGDWHEEGPYAVVHRIAVDCRYHGQKIAFQALKEVETLCGIVGYSVIRMDTHKDNLAMNSLLLKTGYQLCGKITLKDGGERLAYDKKI